MSRERALYYHLPNPRADMKAAYGKWRKWRDPSYVSYVGDKYPEPEHDPYEEGEEEGGEEGAK